MSPELARSLVDENVGVLKRFVEGYLLNNGIAVQLVEAVAKKLLGAEVAAHGIVPDGYAAIPTQLVQTAVRSLVDITVIDPTVFKEGSTTVEFNIETVIANAPSLEFAARYAELVEGRIIPTDVIPSDKLVDAVLTLFHQKQGTITE